MCPCYGCKAKRVHDYRTREIFIYKKHEDGFYVRAKPNLCTPNITIKYISRYLGRPVIANSRIDHYDGDFVTFHYTRHEDNKTITMRIPAIDFIKRLIIHIPEKHLGHFHSRCGCNLFLRIRCSGIAGTQHLFQQYDDFALFCNRGIQLSDGIFVFHDQEIFCTVRHCLLLLFCFCCNAFIIPLKALQQKQKTQYLCGFKGLVGR